MNALLVFVVRLLLGFAFGVVIMRVFRPEWGFSGGVAIGFSLVAVVYAIKYFKIRKNE
jgi:multisubunit Na+/H+ antiporter MnhB subunit